jgi:Bacterial Ig-like domain (group 2)
MPNTKRQLQLAAAFAALLLIAAAVGCNGFFVDPTLTTITVTPTTPSIQQGDSLQMVATGSYDDGSVKTITGSVTWSTADQTVASVNNSGRVTGVGAGSTTITASSANISGSTSVNITLANLTSITVSPSNVSIGGGQTQQYTAMGHFTGSPDQDITTQVTWSASPSTAASISNTSGTQGLLTTMQVTQNTTVTVTATSGSVSGNTTMTVTP